MSPEGNPERIINAVAPIRICDNGGWTDTWFAEHGNVFNIGVYPYAEVQIQTFKWGSQESHVIISPENYGAPYHLSEGSNGKHSLLEKAVEIMELPPTMDLFINIRSEAPPGASTGTSASVCVALVGALNELRSGTDSVILTPLEIAYKAFMVERDKLSLQTGIQDQLCATFGGINYIEMKSYPFDNVITPVQIPDPIWWELESRLCLVFLGRKHSSSDVHTSVIKELEQGGIDAQTRLDVLRHAALKAKTSLEDGDFVSFGQAITENNEGQRNLNKDLICPDANQVLETAKKFKALGGKVNGAGGDGGSLTLISSGKREEKRKMEEAILALNPLYSIIPIYLSRRGLRVWSRTPDQK